MYAFAKTSDIESIAMTHTLVATVFICAVFYSCKKNQQADTTTHYSDDVLKTFVKRSTVTGKWNRGIAFACLDSLYRTFPSISVADKCRYYSFKSTMFEVIRFGEQSYDTAIAYQDSVISLLEQHRLEKKLKTQYINAFALRGEYYARQKRYNHAILDLNRCKQMNQEAGDSCMLAQNIKTLGNIAIEQNDYVKAAALLKEALPLVAACKLDRERYHRTQRYLDDLGFIYSSKGDMDSALLYHSAAVKFAEENKALMKGADTLFPYAAIMNIYGNMALINYRQKQYDAAEEHYNRAIAIGLNIIRSQKEVGEIQYYLALTYIEKGKVKEAEETLAEAESRFPKPHPSLLNYVLLLRTKIAAAKGQKEEALAYSEARYKHNDSINKKKIELLIKSPFVEYERLDKKYQVELLEKDNRNQRNKAKAAIVIGALLALVAAIVFYAFRRIRTVMKKKTVILNQLVQREKELKELMLQREIAEKQLRENELLNLEMELQIKYNTAIMEQRSQISDDLHDELSSSLAALKFYVEDEKSRWSGSPAATAMADISEEVNSVYKNARSYMHSLKANNPQRTFNINDFLNATSKKFAEKGLMDVKLAIDEGQVNTALNAHQHEQLYHISSEAITNIIKHAKATEIAIRISLEGTGCNFSVADNGIGFLYKHTDGLGLNSIRKRVALLEGRMEINAGSNGTTISVLFPLQLNTSEDA